MLARLIRRAASARAFPITQCPNRRPDRHCAEVFFGALRVRRRKPGDPVSDGCALHRRNSGRRNGFEWGDARLTAPLVGPTIDAAFWRESPMARPTTTRDLMRGLRERCSWAFRLMDSVYTPRLVAMARRGSGRSSARRSTPRTWSSRSTVRSCEGGISSPTTRTSCGGFSFIARGGRSPRKSAGSAASGGTRAARSGSTARRATRGRGRTSVPSVAVDHRTPSPDAAALVAEATSRLMAALTETERTIIERCLRNQPNAEIARDLRCSTRTVERARVRACQILRTAIQSEEA